MNQYPATASEGQVSRAPAVLPPMPVLPPLATNESRQKAVDEYVVRAIEFKQTVIDHYVETHSGYWHLSDPKRWEICKAGPGLDRDRLIEVYEEEQVKQDQQGQQIAQLEAAGEQIAPEMLQPVQLLTPDERMRLEAYLGGTIAPEYVWLLAMSRENPSDAQRMMRDYASLQKRYG